MKKEFNTSVKLKFLIAALLRQAQDDTLRQAPRKNGTGMMTPFDKLPAA